MGILDRFRGGVAHEVLGPLDDVGGPTAGAAAALAMSGMVGTPAGARVATVGATTTDANLGVAPIPDKIRRDPRADRARFYARRIGFVKSGFRFYAYQGARAPLTLERSINGGVDWEQVPIEKDPWGNQVVQTIKGPSGTSAELVRPAMYLDGTVGEFMLVDVTGDGATPTFIVRDVQACEKKKGGGGGGRRANPRRSPAGQPQQAPTATWIIKEQEGARAGDGPGAVIEVSADRVFRHWQPDEEWHLMATSSLIGAVDDFDTYWGLLRQLRREVNSRLAMNSILWSASEANATKTRLPDGREVSKLQASFAAAAAAAANDVDDTNVASVAPFLMDSPHEYGKPELIEVPSLKGELLTYLSDARAQCIGVMPLSAAAVLDSQETSENHWSEWLADEKDLQAIGEGLRRVLDTFTAVVLRPALDYGLRTGAWRPAPVTRVTDTGESVEEPGPTDTMMYRVGYDPEVIRRTLDLADRAQWASERGLIHDDAAREYMHFRETDAPNDAQFAKMLERRKALAEATAKPEPQQQPGGLPQGQQQPAALAPGSGPQRPRTSPAQLPAGGAVPNGGQPPTPGSANDPARAAAAAADGGPVATVVDDRWLLR